MSQNPGAGRHSPPQKFKVYGWIGVDLDGTLAVYDGWKGEMSIGAPVPAMVNRVRRWLDNGIEVRIVTARAAASRGEIAFIEAWCALHIGRVLPVTDRKDFKMLALWDDRAVAVEKNTGRILGQDPHTMDFP